MNSFGYWFNILFINCSIINLILKYLIIILLLLNFKNSSSPGKKASKSQELRISGVKNANGFVSANTRMHTHGYGTDNHLLSFVTK